MGQRSRLRVQRRRILVHMRGAALIALLCLLVHPARASPSDEHIRALLIQQSIATYPGNCPCPYNLDRAGRSCGKRSAYSKQGGYAPLCFPSDVTDEMIEEYRRVNPST